MGLEIERRFLIKGIPPIWKAKCREEITQGFLSTDPSRVIRIRIIQGEWKSDLTAYLTVKGKSVGATRTEIETEIDVDVARELLDVFSVSNILEKIRYTIEDEDGLNWEIDFFKKACNGLKIAEIELPSEGTNVIIPLWIGEEITTDFRYSNSNLSIEPISIPEQDGPIKYEEMINFMTQNKQHRWSGEEISRRLLEIDPRVHELAYDLTKEYCCYNDAYDLTKEYCCYNDDVINQLKRAMNK